MSELSIEQKNKLAQIDSLFKQFEDVTKTSNIDADQFSELVIMGKLNLNDEDLSMMDDRAAQRKEVFSKSTVANKKAF
ncbi:MAG: hypothetical protein ACK44N_09330 [Bacteroidota bacterium]|jgi:hypothetical protein